MFYYKTMPPHAGRYGLNMKSLTLIIMLVAISILIVSGKSNADQNAMKCETGPVKKIFGNTSWLVYSCTDNNTVVVVSDTGNPAMPFHFTFYKKEDGYHLSGEGTGNKLASSAAYAELSKLSESTIKQLINETKNGK